MNTNVFDELDDVRPLYSRQMVEESFEYGLQSVRIHPDEVGMDVFLTLFKEKMMEYLYSQEAKTYETT